MFYFVFAQKAENNRLKKPQLANILEWYFFVLLKVGSTGPVDQQVDYVLPEVFPLKIVFDPFYITIIYRSIFLTGTLLEHNWNSTSGNAPDKYNKIIVLIFLDAASCNLWRL